MWWKKTWLVVVVALAGCASLPADHNNITLFQGKNRSQGVQLWSTDQTAAGTQILTYLTQTPNADSNSYSLGQLGQFHIFSAYTPDYGQELWRTDGTRANTTLLKDLLPGPASGLASRSNAFQRTSLVLGKVLLFWSRDKQTLQLNRTDGTAHGTYALQTFPFNPAESINTDLPNFTAFHQQALFWVDDGQHGLELWRTDGTREGSVLLADTTQESANTSIPRYPAQPLCGPTQCYFLSPTVQSADYNQPLQLRLWQTDGTSAQTKLLKTFAVGESVGLLWAQTDSVLWTRANPSDQRPELWQFDLAKRQAKRVYHFTSPQSAAQSLIQVDQQQGLFYLWLSTPDNQLELWRSDLSAQGTQRLQTLPYPNPEYPSTPEMFSFAQRTYFFLKDGVRPAELWLSNGTLQGTKRLLKAQGGFYAGDYGDAWPDKPHSFIRLTNAFIFPTFSPKGRENTQIWSIQRDRPEEPQLIGEFADPLLLPPADFNQTDHVHFIAGQQRWQTDGTRQGTRQIGTEPWPNPPAAQAWFGQPSLFSLGKKNPEWILVRPDASAGEEPWHLTTQPQQTALLKDINTAPASSDLHAVQAVGKGWYFQLGQQWWFSTGRAAHTQPVQGIPPQELAQQHARPSAQQAEHLYFLTQAPQQGAKLWQATQGKARLIQHLGGQGYHWLFPSRTGVYIAYYPTGLNPALSAYLWHWDSQTQRLKPLLKTALQQGNLVDLIELPQGLVYVLEPDYRRIGTGNAPQPQTRLRFWNASTQEDTVLAESFGALHGTGNIFYQTQTHLYTLQPNPSDWEKVDLMRVDLSQKRLQPVAYVPDLNQHSQLYATSQGLYILSRLPQQPDSLWYLGDTATQANLLLSFDKQKSVEFAGNTSNRVYFNVKPLFLADELNDQSELWSSEGTPSSTRLLRPDVEWVRP